MVFTQFSSSPLLCAPFQPFSFRQHIYPYEQEQRSSRTQSFSLNRNLCSDRERANSFTQIKSHNYLERVKLRRQQQTMV